MMRLHKGYVCTEARRKKKDSTLARCYLPVTNGSRTLTGGTRAQHAPAPAPQHDDQVAPRELNDVESIHVEMISYAFVISPASSNFTGFRRESDPLANDE